MVNFQSYGALGLFSPFCDAPTPPNPWAPLHHFPADAHWKARAQSGARLTHGMSGAAAELGFRGIIRTLSLVSSYRRDSRFDPSSAWDHLIGTHGIELGIGLDIGLLFDDLFLSLTHPSPNLLWFTRLLAATDTLFNF